MPSLLTTLRSGRTWVRLALSALPFLFLSLHAVRKLPLEFVDRAETYG